MSKTENNTPENNTPYLFFSLILITFVPGGEGAFGPGRGEI